MGKRTVLVATWSDGLIAIAGANSSHELKGQSVRGLASDGEGGPLAVVDGHMLRRRSPGGAWRTIAVSESDLSCSVAVSGEIYVGTDDAELLRLGARGVLANELGKALLHYPGNGAW